MNLADHGGIHDGQNAARREFVPASAKATWSKAVASTIELVILTVTPRPQRSPPRMHESISTVVLALIDDQGWLIRRNRIARPRQSQARHERAMAQAQHPRFASVCQRSSRAAARR